MSNERTTTKLSRPTIASQVFSGQFSETSAHRGDFHPWDQATKAEKLAWLAFNKASSTGEGRSFGNNMRRSEKSVKDWTAQFARLEKKSFPFVQTLCII
jgi:hypothetical protein